MSDLWRYEATARSIAGSGGYRSRLKAGTTWWELCLRTVVGNLRLDDDVAILDTDRKRLGHVWPLLQFFAAFDRDRIGAHLHPFRIEPGLAVAHVEFPA